MSRDVEQTPDSPSTTSDDEATSSSPESKAPRIPRESKLKADSDVSDPFADTVPAMPMIQRFDRSAAKRHSEGDPASTDESSDAARNPDNDEPEDGGDESADKNADTPDDSQKMNDRSSDGDEPGRTAEGSDDAQDEGLASTDESPALDKTETVTVRDPTTGETESASVEVSPLADLAEARDTVLDEDPSSESMAPLPIPDGAEPASFARNEAESTRELPVLRTEELWFIHDTPPPPLKLGAELEVEGIQVSILSAVAVQTFERRYRVSAEGFDHPLLLKQGTPAAPFVRYDVEARALREVAEDGDTSGLPGLYGYEHIEGIDYILTDLPSGRPYISLLEGSQLSLDDHIAILHALCKAVRKLHYSGFILTSLRPTSFDVSTNGALSVTITDFLNICETVEQPKYALASPFTAPEITELSPADEGADIFSLGALLYRAVTGTEVPPEQIGRIFVPRDPAARAPMIFQLLSRALSPPSERFFDVSEFESALVQLEREREPRLHVGCSLRSSTGINPLRIVNQDSGGYLEITTNHLSTQHRLGFYCVADGMGGHEDGDRASELTIQGALSSFQRMALELSAEEWTRSQAELCKRIAAAGSRHLVETVRAEGGGRRMGTTFTAMLLVNNSIALAHLGDSRAILFREGELIPLSEDHSLVGMMVKAGQMTQEQAEQSDEKNILMRSIGAENVVRPELFDGLETAMGAEICELQHGDRIILVSDGVWGTLPKDVMKKVFESNPATTSLALSLCRDALKRGGADNVITLALDVSAVEPLSLDD